MKHDVDVDDVWPESASEKEVGRVYVVFVVGGIASGKSTVARRLAKLGGDRIDLDDLSREVLAPFHPCLSEISAAFGEDLVDAATGELNRALLAERAFTDEESTRRLEKIEHPFIKQAFVERLAEFARRGYPPKVVAVEVPLLDRALDLLKYANEVICVTCPHELRRERAIERGMDGEDFDKRVAMQPSDAFLTEYANYIIENTRDENYLKGDVDRWWKRFSTQKKVYPSPRELRELLGADGLRDKLRGGEDS